MGGRWGFEEDDEWVDDHDGHPDESTEHLEPYATGQDSAGVLTIRVTDVADVISTSLAPDWKNLLDPAALHLSVLEAANAATMEALARKVEEVDMTTEPLPGTVVAPAPAQHEETPITKEDALRLVDAVTAEVSQFLQQASAISEQTVSAESGVATCECQDVNGRFSRWGSMPPGPPGCVRRRSRVSSVTH